MRRTGNHAGEGQTGLYAALAARLPRLTPRLHLILFAIALLALDFGFRWICRFAAVVEPSVTQKLIPFTVGWSLLLTGIAALLPNLVRRIYMALTGLSFGILCIVHGIYINMFRKFFSFTDLAFAGDGAAFLDTSYLVIRKLLLFWILLCVGIVVLAIVLVPRKAAPVWLVGAVTALLGLSCILVTRFAVLGINDAVVWDQTDDPAFLYEDFTNSRACLSMLGIYQYTFRDIQIVLPKGSSLSAEEREELSAYAESRPHADNEMTGALSGKNLILVQLEAIDTWMLDYMPNLKALKESGLSFANHYAPAYITAGTFNTEFIVNTGLFPATSGTSSSVYTHNTFPDSLAHLFQNLGYQANSFHGSPGTVYNRSAIHENLGYTYHSGIDMGMVDYTMDSQMSAAFDMMTADSPFFTFIITYSGHGPYSETNPIYLAHAKEAQAAATRTDGNYVYAVGHAMETDAFVGELVEYLTEQNLLDSTTLIFYADHYNYYMMNDDLSMEIKGVDSLNLLQHTDWFIYDQSLEPQSVDKYTSSLDVLPTIANLFGLDADYGLLAGDDAFSSGGGYVIFNDNTWVGTDRNVSEEILKRRTYNALLLKSDYWRSYDID